MRKSKKLKPLCNKYNFGIRATINKDNKLVIQSVDVVNTRKKKARW